jgi:hypothetical protein
MTPWLTIWYDLCSGTVFGVILVGALVARRRSWFAGPLFVEGDAYISLRPPFEVASDRHSDGDSRHLSPLPFQLKRLIRHGVVSRKA